jgi:hypothetical protein
MHFSGFGGKIIKPHPANLFFREPVTHYFFGGLTKNQESPTDYILEFANLQKSKQVHVGNFFLLKIHNKTHLHHQIHQYWDTNP